MTGESVDALFLDMARRVLLQWQAQPKGTTVLAREEAADFQLDSRMEYSYETTLPSNAKK